MFAHLQKTVCMQQFHHLPCTGHMWQASKGGWTIFCHRCVKLYRKIKILRKTIIKIRHIHADPNEFYFFAWFVSNPLLGEVHNLELHKTENHLQCRNVAGKPVYNKHHLPIETGY